MLNVAICIAIERYADEHHALLKYAEADARAMAAALQELGFDTQEQHILTGAATSKTSLESRLGRFLHDLHEADTLFLFYAGYAINLDGKNFLTCHDTLVDDLLATSLPMEWLFAQIRRCHARRIVLFLDAPRNDNLQASLVQTSNDASAEEELSSFFDHSPHSRCFASCKRSETSFASDLHKHRIWTHHLLEVLRGHAKLGNKKSTLLTSMQLQIYLEGEVPRTLRETHSGLISQTPRHYGLPDPSFIITDLAPTLARRAQAVNTDEKQLRQIRLVSVQNMPIHQLSGFQKTYRVPDRVNEYTESFAARLATQEINTDLQSMHDCLRSSFKFKRKDMETRGPADGGGSIITSHFDYEIHVSLNPQDPAQICLQRQVMNIRNPTMVLSDAFEEVFHGMFDRLEFRTGKLNHIPQIIDHVEALNEENTRIRYDKDLCWCIMEFKGMDTMLHISADEFHLIQPVGRSTRQLIEFYLEVQRMFSETLRISPLSLSN